MRGAALSTFLAMIVGCAEPALPEASDPEGAFSFSLLAEASRDTQDRQVAWRMTDGLRVTAQRVPVTDSMVRQRTVEAVVQALVDRYALGEVEGSLTGAPCRAGGRATMCTMGWITVPADDGGERYVRRGVLLEVRDEIVLLEVLGPEAASARVDEQAELLERTLQVSEG